MQRSSPLASAGLIRLDASITPPDAAPAPMTVWISSMNRIEPGFFFSSLSTLFKRFSKSPRYFGAGDQRAHVERVHGAVGQHLGHFVLDDHARQAFGDRGLADAGFTDVQRIVLATTAQDLDGALDLGLATDQRIDAPFHRLLVQIGRELLQRGAAIGLATLGFGARRRLFLVGTVLGDLRQAVGDVIDDVQPGHVLHGQQVGRVRVLLAENRHQHVGRGHFLLAAGLHMEHRALQDALEAQRRLHFAVVIIL